MNNLRQFIGDGIQIDGRMIGYRLWNANQYLAMKHGMSEEEVEKFVDKNYDIYQQICQIMALKQSCYLLRRVSYSCQSLSDGLYSLKMKLIHELRDKHNFEFDDDFVESYCEGS